LATEVRCLSQAIQAGLEESDHGISSGTIVAAQPRPGRPETRGKQGIPLTWLDVDWKVGSSLHWPFKVTGGGGRKQQREAGNLMVVFINRPGFRLFVPVMHARKRLLDAVISALSRISMLGRNQAQRNPESSCKILEECSVIDVA
jgi:hypothetical protein